MVSWLSTSGISGYGGLTRDSSDSKFKIEIKNFKYVYAFAQCFLLYKFIMRY